MQFKSHANKKKKEWVNIYRDLKIVLLGETFLKTITSSVTEAVSSLLWFFSSTMLSNMIRVIVLLNWVVPTVSLRTCVELSSLVLLLSLSDLLSPMIGVVFVVFLLYWVLSIVSSRVYVEFWESFSWCLVVGNVASPLIPLETPGWFDTLTRSMDVDSRGFFVVLQFSPRMNQINKILV